MLIWNEDYLKLLLLISTFNLFLFFTESFLFISKASSPLNCSFCQGANEANCTAVQEIRPCTSDDLLCASVALQVLSGQTLFFRGCVDDDLCPFLCLLFNVSIGPLQSCASECCNTSGCNAGSGK